MSTEPSTLVGFCRPLSPVLCAVYATTRYHHFLPLREYILFSTTIQNLEFNQKCIPVLNTPSNLYPRSKSWPTGMTLVFVEHCGQPTHRKLAQCQHDSVDSSAVGAGCRRISLSDVFVKPSKRQCAHENIFPHYRQIRQGIGSVSADLADKI